MKLDELLISERYENTKSMLYNQNPCIYCISRDTNNSKYKFEIKYGFTDGKSEKNEKRCAKDRILEQQDTSKKISETGLTVHSILEVPEDIYKKYGAYSDRPYHKILKHCGCEKLNASEWYGVPKNVDMGAIFYNYDYFNKYRKLPKKTYQKIRLYELQQKASNACFNYFNNNSYKNVPGIIPEFLINAPCRFGKTLVGYDIADRMYNDYYHFKDNDIYMVLVYSFRTEPSDEWESKADMFGYGFITTKSSRGTLEKQYNTCINDGYKKIICFASVMDIYGKDAEGNVKEKNIFIHKTHWHLAISDEFHVGLHNKNATDTFMSSKTFSEEEKETVDKFNRYDKPICANFYVHFSATAFSAIESGRFTDNYFMVTYIDMKNSPDYWSIPNMNIVCVDIESEMIADYTKTTGKNEFNCRELYKADSKGNFVHPELARRSIISFFGTETEKGGPTLFSTVMHDGSMFNEASRHSIFYLDEINSCKALGKLLNSIRFISNNYYVHIVAGPVDAMIEKEKIIREMEEIESGSSKKLGTITITCGKLLTGVTIPWWGAIYLLTEISTRESIMQAIGRLMTPCVNESKTKRLKSDVYVVEIVPNRALELRAFYVDTERVKYKEKSRRETYINTSKYIDFSEMKNGVLKSISVEDYMSYCISEKNKYVDYLINNRLVTGDKKKIKEFFINHPELNDMKKCKLPSIYEKIYVNENDMIVKPINHKENNMPFKKKQFNSEREKVAGIGKMLAAFTWVSDHKLLSLDDIKTYHSNEQFNEFFGIDYNLLDEMFEQGIIYKDIFEMVLYLYYIQNELIEKNI